MESPDAAPPSDLPPEEKELLVTVDEYLAQVKEAGRKEGVQQGMQQGMQQGQQMAALHQFARKLGRPLTSEERSRIVARIDTLGPDRLGDVVLDLSPTALDAWLADPESR